jgi:hypothetical protein
MKVAASRVKKPRISSGSKKVGCPVRAATYMKNALVLVRYNWQHESQDPTDLEEVIGNKLTDELKDRIQKKVGLQWTGNQIKLFFVMSLIGTR